jgi:hypothetical protein
MEVRDNAFISFFFFIFFFSNLCNVQSTINTKEFTMNTELTVSDFALLDFLLSSQGVSSPSAEDEFFERIADEPKVVTSTAGYCLLTTVYIYPNGFQTTKVERMFTNRGLDRTVTIYINNNGKRVQS